MVTRRLANQGTPSADYTDGVTTTNQWGLRVPSDWVRNTNITLNVDIYQSTVASGLTVLQSSIGLNKSGDTVSLTNVESAANANATLTQDILSQRARTITGTVIDPDDGIFWQFTRVGGDAADTIGGTVIVPHGAWIEYTAFM